MKKLQPIILAAVIALGASAPAQSKWGDTPEDSAACIVNVSLYQDFYRQKSYAECYEPWREIIKHCPRFSKTVYQRGSTILKTMVNNAKTAEERDGYIDELMNMYDLRAQYFGEEAKVKAMKAYDLSTLRPSAVKDIYETYNQAIQAGAEQLDENYLTLFFKSTVDYVKAGLAEPTLVIDNYDIVSELLQNILDTVVDDSVKAAKIRGYMVNVESVFSPYASCDQLVSIYQKKFDADPNNIDLLKKITGIMMKKGCTENNPLFFAATEQLYRLEPSPSTAMRMGQMCLGKKQYSKAIEYVKDAVDQLTDKKDRYMAYLILAKSTVPRVNPISYSLRSTPWAAVASTMAWVAAPLTGSPSTKLVTQNKLNPPRKLSARPTTSSALMQATSPKRTMPSCSTSSTAIATSSPAG